MEAPTLEMLQAPDFWCEAWARDRAASWHVRRRIRDENETMEFWNRAAPSYGEQAPEKPKAKVQRVIELLEREMVLTDRSEILDVGCGPGTYALPFAGRAKSVTALDGARGMCEILQQRIKEKSIPNIKVVHKRWGDVDIRSRNLEKRFDLSFASMTPAICDPGALAKFIRTSNRYCCLVLSTGGSAGKAKRSLWRRIFHEEMDAHRSSSFIFIFNLLYSMGYRPALQYVAASRIREEHIDAAIERLCRSFWLYAEMTHEIKKTIADYVNEHAEEGIFREEIGTRLGVMTWNVVDTNESDG